MPFYCRNPEEKRCESQCDFCKWFESNNCFMCGQPKDLCTCAGQKYEERKDNTP
jgi:hypothetical protein